MKRRIFLGMVASGIVAAGFAPILQAAEKSDYEVLSKTDAEWKALLKPEQYHILREEGTEAPFTSALLNEHREGMFCCAACQLPLFHSNTKFDSGTGWPSFFDCIKGHVDTKRDTSLFMERTEYHCAKCGGHHGHVFNDGPKPTGLRYCSNGAALNFVPKGT